MAGVEPEKQRQPAKLGAIEYSAETGVATIILKENLHRSVLNAHLWFGVDEDCLLREFVVLLNVLL